MNLVMAKEKQVGDAAKGADLQGQVGLNTAALEVV